MADLFEWADLIAPIGISLLALVLCTIAAVKAKKRSAKITCIATALVFLMGNPFLYFMRYEARRFSYTLDYSLKIRNGTHDQCPQEKTRKWLAEGVTFWKTFYGESCIQEGLKDVLVMCKDQPRFKLSFSEKVFLGYATHQYSVVGYWEGQPALIKKVFIHEISHNILFACLGAAVDDAHHEMYEKVKFPYR